MLQHPILLIKVLTGEHNYSDIVVLSVNRALHPHWPFLNFGHSCVRKASWLLEEVSMSAGGSLLPGLDRNIL
uniref:Uncharacterized protein n=1 Tax=Anguilla anguilla TaxID=7936 RepID=A0A0E9WYW6_ANGAN